MILNYCMLRVCRQVPWTAFVGTKPRYYESQSNECSKYLTIYKQKDKKMYEDRLSNAIRIQLEQRGIWLCDRCNRQLVASIYSCLENDFIDKRKMAAMFDDLISIIKSQADHNKELMRIINRSSTPLSCMDSAPSRTVTETLRGDGEEYTVGDTECPQKLSAPENYQIYKQNSVFLKNPKDVDSKTTTKNIAGNRSSKDLVPAMLTSFHKTEECKRMDFYYNSKLEAPDLKLDDNCQLPLERSLHASECKPYYSCQLSPRAPELVESKAVDNCKLPLKKTPHGLALVESEPVDNRKLTLIRSSTSSSASIPSLNSKSTKKTSEKG